MLPVPTAALRAGGRGGVYRLEYAAGTARPAVRLREEADGFSDDSSSGSEEDSGSEEESGSEEGSGEEEEDAEGGEGGGKKQRVE